MAKFPLINFLWLCNFYTVTKKGQVGRTGD